MSLVLTNSYIFKNSGSTQAALTFLTSTEIGIIGSGVINYDAACTPDGIIRMLIRRGAQGGTGVLTISRDSGATWTPYLAGLGDMISVSCSHDGQIMYVVSYLSGMNYKSVDGGYNWTSFASLGDEFLIRTNQNGSKAVVGLFNGTSVFITNNYGNTWSSIALSQARSLAMSSDGNIVILSSVFTYISTNGGVSFSPLGGFGATNVAIDGTGTKILVGSTSSNYLKLSTNGGASFNNVTSLGIQTWARPAISDDGNMMVARNTSGQRYISYNGGSTWAVY